MADPTPSVQECVEGYLFHSGPPRLLIFRRPPARGSIWVPVSGKVDPSDTDFPAALERELREETGFTRFERVFPLDWEVTFDGPDGRPWRLHSYGVELDAQRVPRLSDEHDAFDWVDPDTAISRLHYPDNRDAVRRLLERVGDGPSGPPTT